MIHQDVDFSRDEYPLSREPPCHLETRIPRSCKVSSRVVSNGDLLTTQVIPSPLLRLSSSFDPLLVLTRLLSFQMKENLKQQLALPKLKQFVDWRKATYACCSFLIRFSQLNLSLNDS